MVSMVRSLLRQLARGVVFGLAALGLLVVLVTFTPVTAWYARALSCEWTDGRGEVLIALGAGTLDGSTLDAGSYWRSVYTLLMWKGRGYGRIVVAGGGDVGPLMRDFLVTHGVEAAAIQVEGASRSTRENAVNVTRLLAGTPGRKVLLTSDYHMFRARRAFEKAGLHVITEPYPDVLKRYNSAESRWGAFVDLCVETVKIGYYWAKGWI